MKKILNKILVIFLMIQPLLDLNILYDERFEIFSFAPSTLIRIIAIVCLSLLVFVKKSYKENKTVIIYMGLLFLYCIFHLINGMNFKANITSSFTFSLMEEIFYLFRMSLPVFLVYLVFKLDVKGIQLKKIVLSNVIIYSLVILLASLFTFGYQSYSDGRITKSIIDWFISNDVNIVDSGTKGLFVGTNRLGVFLSALLPIVYYFYYQEKGNRLIALIMLQIISLMLICTRISSYVWILIAILMLVLYILFNRRNVKSSKIVFSLITLVLGSIVLSFSPIKNRIYAFNLKNKYEELYWQRGYAEKLKKYNCQGYVGKNDKTYKEKVSFIKNEYTYFNLGPNLYIETLYNYNFDPNFWISIMKLPYDEHSDGRKIQWLTTKRIYSLNNNKLDKYFGFGYTPLRNSKVYIEKDIFVHFFSMGIIGILCFFGIYFLPIIFSMYLIIKSKFKKCSLKLMTLNCSLCVFLFSSILCGHVLDEMITYIAMSLLAGMILLEINKLSKLNENIKLSKVSLIIPVYKVEEYLNECLDSVVNQDFPQKYLEVLLIDDASPDNSLQIMQDYCSKYNNFKLIINEINKGQAISRNEAIKKATGNYIVFLDSDDILDPKCISTLYNKIVAENADVAMAQINSYNSKGFYGYYSDKYIDDDDSFDVYQNKPIINCISICSKIYKTSLIKNIKFLDKTIHEDNSFTLTMFFKAQKIVTIPKYLYYRRIREGENKSIMQKLDYKTFTDLIKNYQETIKNIGVKNNSFLILYMIRKLNNEIYKHVLKEDEIKATNDILDFLKSLPITNFKKNIFNIYNYSYRTIIKLYALKNKIRG